MKSIAQHISEKEISPTYFANQLGVHPAIILSWNDKESSPNSNQILAICELLDVFQEEIDILRT
jgi:DNA-binding transcriptional regulator YiaG